MTNVARLVFDGGGSHNGSPAGWGWAAYVNGEEVAHGCGGLPPGTTNNVAEYHALTMAATWAVVHDWELHGFVPERFEFYGDSDLVVSQVTGVYAVRSPNLRASYRAAVHALEPLAHTMHWHPRRMNKRADELATLGRKLYRTRMFRMRTTA
jgi:ribonuclease HI